MKKFLSLLVVGSLTLSTYSQDAKSVVQKYYDALGGKTAENNIKSYSYTASFNIMGQDFPATMKVICGTGALMSIDLMGMAMKQVWYNGAGWQINPMMGSDAVDMSADEATSLISSLTLFGRLHPDSVNADYKYVKVDETEQQSPHAVSIEKDGTEALCIFDKGGLMIRQEVSTPEGKVTVHMSDYKKTDHGFMFPYRQKTDAGMAEINIVVVNFAVNPEISEDEFKRP